MYGFLPVQAWQVVRMARQGPRGDLAIVAEHEVWLAAAPSGDSTEDTADNRDRTVAHLELWGTDPAVDILGSDRMRGPGEPDQGVPRWRVIGRPDRWRGRGLGGIKVIIEEANG